jgi:predicted RNA binding protein YcfA (HicA-like mRNA interferase family)
MSKLPSISGRECISVFEKLDFKIKRQEGSHIILRKNNPFTQVVIPNHKSLDRGTLRAIIRQSGLTLNDFIDLMDK